MAIMSGSGREFDSLKSQPTPAWWARYQAEPPRSGLQYWRLPAKAFHGDQASVTRGEVRATSSQASSKPSSFTSNHWKSAR